MFGSNVLPHTFHIFLSFQELEMPFRHFQIRRSWSLAKLQRALWFDSKGRADKPYMCQRCSTGLGLEFGPWAVGIIFWIENLPDSRRRLSLRDGLSKDENLTPLPEAEPKNLESRHQQRLDSKLWRWFWEPIKTSLDQVLEDPRFTVSDVCRPTSLDNWLCQKAIGVEVDPTSKEKSIQKA